MKKRPRVDDYRDQLRELLSARKSEKKILSQSYYAQKISASPSYLTQVLSKKKHLSYEKLDKLCAVLKLDSQQSLQILESFLRLTESNKYLLRPIRECLDLYAHRDRSLMVFSKPEKAIASDPLKSLLLAICCDHTSVREIEAYLRDKNFTSASIKEGLKWLLKNGFLEKNTDAVPETYKAVPSFVGTEVSPSRPEKYLAWLEHVTHAITHPEKYRPGRIQSLVLSFDDEAISKLQSEFNRMRAVIVELSENSSAEKSKAIYIQNLFMTFANRDKIY